MNSAHFMTSKIFRSLLAAFCLTLLAALNAKAQVSVPGWTPPPRLAVAKQTSSVEDLAKQGEAPLSRLYGQIRTESSLRKQLPSITPNELKQNARSPRLRIGAIRQLPSPLDSFAEMSAFDTPQGRVFVAHIASEGALSLRLHFSNFNLPAGAKLFLYPAKNPNSFLGPYEAGKPGTQSEFWSSPIPGDDVVIEYFVLRVGQENNQSTVNSLPFRVTQISHAFTDERMVLPGVAQQTSPGTCNSNVTPEWTETARSVARLRFVAAEGEFLCTGTLLNTTNNSGRPFILTANHCISKPSEAESISATWLYDTPGSTSLSQESNGAFLLATGQRSDFTLVELRFPNVPSGVRYSGWTTQMPSASTSVASIHHPLGSYKRLSLGNVVNDSCLAELSDYRCENLLKVRWNTGITEPGSSGGGLWVGGAADPRLVGTLLGGTSGCNNRSGTDYYGRFDLAFEAISGYLTGTGCAYELSAWQRVAEASGSTGSVSVIISEGEACQWTASSDAAWIKLTGNTNGSGNGSVAYSIEPNPSAKPRVGSVIAAGQVLTIFQLGSETTCQASVITSAIGSGQPINGNLSNSDCRSLYNAESYADRFTFDAAAGQEIAIQLRSSQFDTFLTLISPSGEIIAQNDDDPFSGGSRIPLGGFVVAPVNGRYTIEVSALDASATGNYTLELKTGCVYSATIEKSEFGHVYEDGRIRVRVVSGSSCQWMGRSNRPWLTFQPVTYTGDGTGNFLVNSHTSDRTRTGTVTMAGIPFSITQYPACSSTRPATLSTTNLKISGYYGEHTINVGVPSNKACSWEAFSNESWLQIQTGFRGTGNGTVKFQALPNNSLSVRTAIVMIAGQAVTLNQEPAGGICQTSAIEIGQTRTGSLSASDCGSFTQGSFADHLTFNAVARQQVAILVTSNDFAPSVSVYGPGVNGDGFVSNGPSSTETETRLPAQGWGDSYYAGKYTIIVTSRDGGRTGNYSVSLIPLGGAGCGYLITDGTNRVAGEGATGNIVLSVQNGCPWTATSDVPWITFPTPTGSGGQTIPFTAAPNLGAFRRGIVRVANRFFEVIQDKSCGAVEITPKRFYANAAGSFLSANVETGFTCPLTATSKSNWIKVENISRQDIGSNVSFSCASNPGTLRVGLIEIAGQTLEVVQGGRDLAIVSAASFTPVVAPGSIASVFGLELATGVEASTAIPLATVLAGSRVSTYDGKSGGFEAPLFFVSPTQINFYVPERLQPADGSILVSNVNGMGSLGPMKIERVAPALFAANANGQGVPAAVVLRIKTNGAQSYEPIAVFDSAQNKFVAQPIDLGPESDQLFLILFGTGIRNRTALSNVVSTVGGVSVPVSFAGAQNDFVGVDQINISLPRSLAKRGEVDLELTVDSKSANKLKINIK